MRVVVVTEPGKLELSWMWLPTFLGQDPRLMQEIGKELGPKLQGKPMTEEVLNEAHEMVLDFICEKYKTIKGLRDYLDAIKFVEDGS